LKANEGEEVYKYNKKYLIELLKGDPLPHLWTHLVTTTDAILYIIYDEADTQVNFKDLTELLLDDRTSEMPIIILIFNQTEEYDKSHTDELTLLVNQH